MAEAKKKITKTIKKPSKDLKIAEKEAVKETSEIVKELVKDEKLVELIEKVEEDLKEESGKPLAKAGKRSIKALKEKEEKLAKEERKAKKEEEFEKPTKAPVKARPIIERKGKKFQEAAKLIDNTKQYNLKEALDLAIKTSKTKFDASIEMHIRLGVDPKQADQNIRASLVLPAGTGKTKKVAVYAEEDKLADAKKAGADIALGEEFLEQLEKNIVDFDVLIATPEQMSKLSKYARLLGPKGLMPNPKSGTVTNDVAKAVSEAKTGKVEYRVDSTGIIHVVIGKVSFGTDRLLENAKALLDSIKSVKPPSLKSSYILSIYTASSMGPSVKINYSEL
jgi:large subunit ribosomal protein L1